MANFKKIRELCNNQNITQDKLATAVNLSRQGLRDLIKKNTTKTEIIERIAKELKVPVGYFFDEEETEKADNTMSDQLIKTQTDLIEFLKKENAKLKIELEDERKDKRLPSGYALASEPVAKLKP